MERQGRIPHQRWHPASFGRAAHGVSGEVRLNTAKGGAAGAVDEKAVESIGGAAARRGEPAIVGQLFVDLGNGSCTTDCAIANANGPPLIPNVADKFNESIFRAGINFRFGSWFSIRAGLV